jgi:hypothetical protein
VGAFKLHDLITIAIKPFMPTQYCLRIALDENTPLPNLWRTLARWGVAAMSIQSFVKPGAFEPEAIALMSEAFDAACQELQDTGQPQIVLEIIAERIIAAARLGERDPVRLRKAALVGYPGQQD